MSDVTEQTFAAVFDANRERLVNYVHRIVGCRVTAEDIAQEAFARLYKVMSEGGVDQPRPFLYKIARNVARDHFRRERVRDTYKSPVDYHDGAFDPPSFAVGQDDVVANRQVIAALERAIAALPERRREIFILKRLHGMRSREIAERLGISESAVEKHLKIAFEACLAAREEIET